MLYKLVKPLLFKMDPERAHSMTIRTLKTVQKYPKLFPVMERFFKYESHLLKQHIQGLTFANPVGLAAGFDKSCEVPNVLQYAGFGAIELGGITPKPQSGNPKPRMYRLLEDDAIINRMGFNNIGMNKALSNMRRHTYHIPVGINVGVNKVTPHEQRFEDYIKVMDTFKHDASFFTINISSPNTANLQDFHSKTEFKKLCKAVKAYQKTVDKHVPTFLKVTSDIDVEDLDKIIDLITDTFDGIVLANTTQQRDNLHSANGSESGGLSGRPLFDRSLALVNWVYKRTNGKFLIIATGGIFNAADAIRMMRNGATLLQSYTSFL